MPNGSSRRSGEVRSLALVVSGNGGRSTLSVMGDTVIAMSGILSDKAGIVVLGCLKLIPGEWHGADGGRT